MDVTNFPNAGVILISVEDPISQLLRKANRQYYTVVGFCFKNPKIGFILGDILGVHMSRHLETKWTLEEFEKSFVYKLASNIIILDYISDQKKFINHVLKDIKIPLTTSRLDDYHWLTSLFGYQLADRQHLTCYEIINHILINKKSEDLRYRFNLVKTEYLSTPKHIKFTPPKDLFRLQQKLITNRKEYINELVAIFSELLIKSPPFYQIIYNYDISHNIWEVITDLINTNSELDVKKLITIINEQLDDTNYRLISDGSTILRNDNIQIMFRSGRNTTIPTIGYDLSEFTKDECKEILLVVDAKSNKNNTYETLKTDLATQIARKN